MHQFCQAADGGDLPRAFDTEQAAVGLQRLLEAAGKSENQGLIADLQRLADDPGAGALLAALFGNSPFLTQCAVREPEFTAELFESGPEAALIGIADTLQSAAPDLADDGALKKQMRIAKRRAALSIAAADIARVWDQDRVTSELSRFAEICVAKTANFLLARLAKKGAIELPEPENAAASSGLIVLGLGKLGARELNYSSDIDLIILFDPGAVASGQPDRLQQNFARLARDLVNILTERTEDGYVFRTDIRLRPDPSSTPPAISVLAAEAYYESVGQNWERAAMIKARQIAGDRDAGEKFRKKLLPFIWRKNLDFAAIRDVHSIKRQINAHRGGGEIAIEGHDVKIGRGGIREVEFFAQTQQLIWGGRNPNLRNRSTCAALALLAEAALISNEAAAELTETYWYLRRVEHHLQMIDDQQTHALPKNEEGVAALAAFLGYAEAGAFRTDILFHLRRVEGHYAALFEEAPDLSGGAEIAGNLIFTGSDDDPDTLNTLETLGYREPRGVASRIRGWHRGRSRATRTERARQILTELMPAILAAFAGTPDPDGAFSRFDDFVARLPGGVQLFSMFHANPRLLELVAEIMGGAPKLAEHLERNPAALESVLSPDFFEPPPTASVMNEALAAQLGSAKDFEDVLDICRRWANDAKLQVGVQSLRHLISWDIAGNSLSDIAQTVITQLSQKVADEFALKHGHVPGNQWAIVALGKLGGREMTPASDMDLIFIYDHKEGTAASDGPTPIDPSRYYARLCQRLINAITAPTAEGRLYEVDMRLRPSGNAGPIASHITAFTKYHEESAWTWEHMALARGRVLCGDAALTAKIERVAEAALQAERDPAKLVADIAEMRQRIDKEHHTETLWEVKYIRGGLVDIEFIVQYLQLRHAHATPAVLSTNTMDALTRLEVEGHIAADDGATLRRALALWQSIQGLLRLTMPGVIETGADIPEALKQALVRGAGAPDFQSLEALMEDTASQVLALFAAIIGSSEP
ncbi:MAG: bifunctional [glutamine synthetase] adenylyltransferase/[glutamine synthetase]-adenylyl-L-tyrosine phosphorylase [Rhodospirillaceae bacterium]|nr:bifunctional [glutamine synthetase] adenylyltransferase/[glutamine synthetase]-adenylyl-L-tyrosine phosphorylase [Rhodospirillaceae bacterium]MBT4119137.1 bifunctional [glutamine synthetase] adenylyltransferase/[glutamine synthetase]-adenylyl-L-tyrosine phosphorylase [Rhodospirillaceae bacterium]MBT4674667.1 bifunctional [glutamine synthetase] adenylyltransferase/[glutamine synthetase]-adenylyl-L-tyrosine phosphorylase [Rhodospirillaceae bacterium]MBT5179747.1 bifunctional [glutamine syntheta